MVSVELNPTQLQYAFNEAVERFSYYITQWSMRNNIGNALGLPSDQDFTMRFVKQDFEFAKSFAAAYSVQAGVGGDIPVYRDSFVITESTQNYYLPSGRTITEIMWTEPVAIDRALVDPYANPQWATTEFGFAYMGNSLTYIIPVYWSLYQAQNFELRNRIRRGDFSYKLLPWTGGQSQVTLYPVPGSDVAGRRVWYFYWDNSELNKYDGTLPGEYVTSPADIRMDEIPYSAMNSWAQMWIKNFTLALSKETLGRIRGKFANLPIPDADVQMDADALRSEGKEEQQALIQELTEELQKLDYDKLLEGGATTAESINKQLSFSPLGIWIG